LYLGSATLKHHYDNGSPDDELPLLEWACQDLLYKIQTRLHEVLNNFPNRLVASVVRMLTFPLGKPYKRPSDELGQTAARLILQPGILRDRLTEGVYIPMNKSESVAQLDDALEKSFAAEPAIRKLRSAMKSGTLPHGDPEDQIDAGVSASIITDPEAAVIRAAMAARKIVIQVDAFLPDYLTKEHTEWVNDSLDGVAGQSL
jgi:acyl-CoA dehydrogenase